MSEMTEFMNLSCREKGENRTEWDFEFWCNLYGLSDLHYTARRRIISDAVEMEDKYWRKRLNETCIAQTGRANLHGWQMRDVCEGALNGAYRVGLVLKLVTGTSVKIARESKHGPGCRDEVIASLL